MQDWGQLKNKEVNFNFFITGLKNLWEMIGDKKKYAYQIIVWIFIVKFINLSIPYLIKIIVDNVQYTINNANQTTDITFMLLGLLALFTIGNFTEQIILEKKFQRFVITMENYWPTKIFAKLLHLPLSYHETEKTGKTVSLVNKGIERMVGSLHRFRYDIIPNLIYIVLNFIFLFLIHWQIGAVFTLAFIIAALINIKGIRKYAGQWDDWEELKEQSDGVFTETIYCFKTVMAYAKEKNELKKYQEQRDMMRKIDLRACLGITNYFFLFDLIMTLGFMASIYLAINLTVSGQIGVGSIVFLVATSTNAIRCLWGLLHEYNEITRQIIAANRLVSLLNTKSEIPDGKDEAKPQRAKLETDLSFKYESKENNALDEIKMTFEPGKMTALVGISGSGKSTTFKLLNRSYDPQVGGVRLAGENIKKYTLNSYRRLFATVSQDVDIFDRSIRDNISYANADASMDKINEAIKAACLDTDLAKTDKFPDGINTMVGERGVRLSGGERQRVGIARAYLALLNGARILILDEATSNLDSLSEKVVQEMVANLNKKRDITIIVCAHRLSTITMSDHIYVMENGSIVEEGDHKKLMKHNGFYCRLVEMQRQGLLRS